jgi:hypothetical protein
VALQIPLVVSPREQRSALVAVKDGVALSGYPARAFGLALSAKLVRFLLALHRRSRHVTSSAR